MNKVYSIGGAIASGLLLGSTTQGALIINEVYPGGGSSSGSPAFTRDFVELRNTDANPVLLNGFVLQYASATGNFTNTIFAFGPGSVIGANDFLTVATGGAGTAGTALSPTQVNNLNGTGSGAGLSATNGAVRLIDGSAAVVDLVGYGTASNFEGTAAASPTSTAVSLNRTNFADTGNNAADFTSATPSPTAGLTSVANPVPEPSSLGVVAVAGLLAARRRRRTA